MHHEHERHLGAARRHLTLALHELLTPTVDGKSNALLFASMALLDIAKSDPSEKALGQVITVCERAKRGKP